MRIKILQKIGDFNAFSYRGARQNKVALVIGGGSGHEPLFTSYCGAGLAMLNSMGGASGVIFGSLYLEGAKGMDEKAFLTPADLAMMERKSLVNIQKRGGAQAVTRLWWTH